MYQIIVGFWKQNFITFSFCPCVNFLSYHKIIPPNFNELSLKCTEILIILPVWQGSLWCLFGRIKLWISLMVIKGPPNTANKTFVTDQDLHPDNILESIVGPRLISIAESLYDARCLFYHFVLSDSATVVPFFLIEIRQALLKHDWSAVHRLLECLLDTFTYYRVICCKVRCDMQPCMILHAYFFYKY